MIYYFLSIIYSIIILTLLSIIIFYAYTLYPLFSILYPIFSISSIYLHSLSIFCSYFIDSHYLSLYSIIISISIFSLLGISSFLGSVPFYGLVTISAISISIYDHPIMLLVSSYLLLKSFYYFYYFSLQIF